MKLHRAHVTKDDVPSKPTMHKVTGSSTSRVKRKFRKGAVHLTVVTVTCSCGETVTGEAETRGLAETRATVAFRRHARGSSR